MSGRRSGRYRSDIEALLRVLVLVLDRLCDSGSKPEGQSPETVREPLWHGLGLVAAHDRYTPQQSAQRDHPSSTVSGWVFRKVFGFQWFKGVEVRFCNGTFPRFPVDFASVFGVE